MAASSAADRPVLEEGRDDLLLRQIREELDRRSRTAWSGKRSSPTAKRPIYGDEPGARHARAMPTTCCTPACCRAAAMLRR